MRILFKLFAEIRVLFAPNKVFRSEQHGHRRCSQSSIQTLEQAFEESRQVTKDTQDDPQKYKR